MDAANGDALGSGDAKQQVSIKSVQSAAKPSKASAAESANRGRFTGRKFSREVPIERLLNLDLNQGAGEFVAGPEADSLCVAIKRQPGELYGTTDLVFLPTLSVKNALPCNMRIKRRKRLGEAEELMLRQSS